MAAPRNQLKETLFSDASIFKKRHKNHTSELLKLDSSIYSLQYLGISNRGAEGQDVHTNPNGVLHYATGLAVII